MIIEQLARLYAEPDFAFLKKKKQNLREAIYTQINMLQFRKH
jgi:hypothetical protein